MYIIFTIWRVYDLCHVHATLSLIWCNLISCAMRVVFQYSQHRVILNTKVKGYNRLSARISQTADMTSEASAHIS